MTLELIPAHKYAIEELVEIYNCSREGYLVPMQMTAAQLAEYIQIYDVDLEHSLVACIEGTEAGLGMLGVRENRSWITRLGVDEAYRGRGIGRAILRGLLERSDSLEIGKNILEVIDGNHPAQQIFLQEGFQKIRRLLILKRMDRVPEHPAANFVPLDEEHIHTFLSTREGFQAWTNETDTYKNLDRVAGYRVDDENIGRGWLVYQANGNKISRLTYSTEQGDPAAVTAQLLNYLHHLYPDHRIIAENISIDDPGLPAFKATGYQEAFSRIEMLRKPEGIS